MIGSEKTTLMAQKRYNVYFYVGLKLQVCSLFWSCFKRIAGSVTKLWVRTVGDVRKRKNEIIAYKAY